MPFIKHNKCNAKLQNILNLKYPTSLKCETLKS